MRTKTMWNADQSDLVFGWDVGNTLVIHAHKHTSNQLKINLTWMFFDIFAGTERARKLHTERLQSAHPA